MRSTFDPQRKELRIRIGCLTWVVLDRLSYDGMVTAWRQVQKLAPVVLPPTPRPPRKRVGRKRAR